MSPRHFITRLLAKIFARHTDEAQVSLAYKSFDAGDYAAAVEHFGAAIKSGAPGDHAEMHTLLGLCYDRLDRPAEAVQAQRKAVQINPEYHEAWNNLSNALRVEGHLDEADRCAARALEINPDYAFAYNSLGTTAIHRDQPREALAHIERALALHGGVAIFHSNHALALAMLRRYDEAERELRHAVTLGFKNWPEVKSRINALREFDDEGDDPAPVRAIGFSVRDPGAPSAD